MTTGTHRVVAIVQARMGSSRLPGKVLQDLAGRPMLARVIERMSRAQRLNDVVVATTDQARDDVIAHLCQERGWSCFRGSEYDVLDRYYRAALEFGAQLVVRVTSDCPLIDPEIIDQHVSRMEEGWAEVDFVTNMARQTYPLGLAVEALPIDVLARMKRMSTTPELCEHVTTLAYAEPDWFRIEHVLHPVDLSHMRWTVDTKEDLEFVRLIFEHFGHDFFSWQEALAVLASHPKWMEINRTVSPKVMEVERAG
ncbi:MAG TPA: glycosyltransferase family protein [Terriglobales bacterium]